MNEYTADDTIPCEHDGCKNSAIHRISDMNVCDFHAYTVGGYPSCAHPGCKAIGDNCLVAGSPDRYCGTHYDEIRKHNAEQERIVLETLVGPRKSDITTLIEWMLPERQKLGLDCLSFQIHDTHVSAYVHIGGHCRCCSANLTELARTDKDVLYERIMAEVNAMRWLMGK